MSNQFQYPKESVNSLKGMKMLLLKIIAFKILR